MPRAAPAVRNCLRGVFMAFPFLRRKVIVGRTLHRTTNASPNYRGLPLRGKYRLGQRCHQPPGITAAPAPGPALRPGTVAIRRTAHIPWLEAMRYAAGEENLAAAWPGLPEWRREPVGRRLPPPAYAKFPRLLHRTDQETKLNAQQLYVAELDANVPGNHQSGIQHALQDVGQTIPVRGSSDELCLGHETIPFACD